ncbi:unnamed protein product [Caenorhabditis nigoni]
MVADGLLVELEKREHEPEPTRIVELQTQLTMEQGLRQDQMIEQIRQDHESEMSKMETKHREETERRTQGQLEGDLKCLRKAHSEWKTTVEVGPIMG